MSRVKICGITDVKEVEFLNELKPDYIGFVFAAGRRKISPEKALELKKHTDDSIQTVGVFVNEDIDRIVQIVESGATDIIQLHGDEDAEYIKKLKIRTKKEIIKAVRVRNANDIEKSKNTEADYILYDTFVKDAYGGSGRTFDWEMLPKGEKYFLAGGISADNADIALSYEPYCIDVSSGVETEGKKDKEKVRKLIEKIRNH